MNKDRYQSTSARRALALLNSPQRRVQQFERSAERLSVLSLHCWTIASERSIKNGGAQKQANQIPPNGWKSKQNTVLPSVLIVPFHISTQINIHRHSESWIWKYCVHSPSRKPIIVLVTIFDFRAIHLSTWIASACKHLGERLRSGRKHSIALRALALLNTPLVNILSPRLNRLQIHFKIF